VKAFLSHCAIAAVLAANLGAPRLTAKDPVKAPAGDDWRDAIRSMFTYQAPPPTPPSSGQVLRPAASAPAGDSAVVHLTPVVVRATSVRTFIALKQAVERKAPKSIDQFSIVSGGTLIAIPLGPIKVRLGGFRDPPDPFGSPGFWSPIHFGQ
jgi:hypothetical protein